MIMKKLLLLAGTTAILGGCSAHQPTDAKTTTKTSSPAPAATRLRGVVQSLSANALTIQTYDGQSATVSLGAHTGFAWVIGSSLAMLKDGDFIGTATTGPDNALRAVELVIFPESMRGAGEGHYAWDVPGAIAATGGGSGSSNTMTNGTVQQQSAMTNGTVQQQSAMTNGTVTGGAGKPGATKLTISYKGGTAQVLVPVATPIVRFEPTQQSVLKKGQKIFAVKTADAPEAKFIAIGKDGLTPPM